LTRAEMACMLLKMVDTEKITPVTGHNLVGKLVVKDRTDNKISLQTTHGTFSYGIAPYFMAFRSGSAVSLDLINVGDTVRVALNRSQKCQIISYYSGSQPTTAQMPPTQGIYTYSGTVISFGGGMLEFQSTAGVSLKLPLSTSVRITEYGNNTLASSVTGGKSGSITVSDGRIIKIDLNSTTTAASTILSGNRGYIMNKYWDSFSVRQADETVQVISQQSANFIKNGEISSYSSIKPGMLVEISSSGQSSYTINILDSSRKLFGRVDEISSDNIVLLDDENKTIIRSLTQGVQIKDLGGYGLKAQDIQVGSYLEISLDSNDLITSILVRESYGNPDGTVDEIWNNGSRRITIYDANGSRQTYYMREDVTVTEDGALRSPDYVLSGMKVSLTRDSYNYVTRIDIINGSAIEGRIIYISNSSYGPGQIQIQRSNGRTETYNLTASTLVRDGSAIRSFNNLTEGMNVSMALDSRNYVARIDIKTGSSTLEGRITYIYSSSYGGQIQIQKSSGRTESYYLDSYVLVRDGSTSRSISYLTEGMNVSLTLGNGNRVTVIDLISSGTTEGLVTYIQRTGIRRIDIRRGNGVAGTYYLSESVLVRDGYTDRNLDYINENMNVSLTLDNSGHVVRIDIISGLTSVEGTVTYFNSSGVGQIQIQRSSGRTESYYLSSSVQLRQGSSSRSISYLTQGMIVRLSLDSANRVTLVDVTGSSFIEGVVNNIRITGSKRIQLRTNAGDLESYSLPDSIIVRDWGVARGLDTVLVGMKVKIHLDIDGNPLILEITG